MYQQYVPNERVTRRCAKLWRREIKAGTYDAGDGMINAVASMLKAKTGALTKEQLDAFETDLAARLMRPHKQYADQDESQLYPVGGLHTDYHPDYVLSCALDASGIGKGSLHVPIKSSTFLSADHVRESFGYRAFGAYHYILTDTLWMVTTLSGSKEEMETLKKAVLEGRLPEIRVEDDDFNAVSPVKHAQEKS